MKKLVSVLLLATTCGLFGCSSTPNGGGDKAENNQSKGDNIECVSTGSRLKKTC